MAKVIDLTGLRFERWKVESFSHQTGKMLYWNCVCDCGTRKAVFGADLKRGMSKSCGCLMKEKAAERKFTHGASFHPAYRSWIEMKSRCTNPEKESYKDYGGRGISVCDKWQTFEGFWSDMAETWRRGLSIDRIEVNGHYEPSNCKWSTPKEQANNRRNNHLIPTPSGPMTVSLAAEQFGISRSRIFTRIRRGWSESDVLKPLRKV